MQRARPYRREPPDGYERALQALASTRMFLVQSMGPLSFAVRSEGSEDTFRVKIGELIECSCKSGAPCCHILFAMLRVLRVPDGNALLWQEALVPSELNQILARRFHDTRQRDRAVERRKKATATAADNTVPRKPVDKEENCPICQEAMGKDGPPLTWCRTGCGNNVHGKCMKVWADHRTSMGA